MTRTESRQPAALAASLAQTLDQNSSTKPQASQPRGTRLKQRMLAVPAHGRAHSSVPNLDLPNPRARRTPWRKAGFRLHRGEGRSGRSPLGVPKAAPRVCRRRTHWCMKIVFLNKTEPSDLEAVP
jgi:hypothetical protein